MEQHRSYCIEISITVSDGKNKYAQFWPIFSKLRKPFFCKSYDILDSERI